MIIFIVIGIVASVIFLQRLIYIKFAFANLKVNYNFSSAEVNEGDIFYITEEIENKKYLPLPAVSTVIEAGAGIAFANGAGEIIEQKSVFSFSTVGAYKKIIRTWRIKAVKRGRFNIDDITVTIKDIFGLVSVSNDFSCGASVLILPSPYNKDEQIDFANFIGGSEPVLAGYYSDPFNIIKISPYTYCEPMNKINWNASAKSRELMVNYEQPSVSDKVLVVLDASDASFLLEKNIKLCATLSRIIPEDSEITFLSNAILPENYKNPLIRVIDSDGGFIKTHSFTLYSHDKNFRRILAEITGASRYDSKKLIELIERQSRREFYGNVFLVKGGKIINANDN